MTKAQQLEKAVKWAEETATDNSHGYSNIVDDNLGQNGDFDCGGFISAALKYAGLIPEGSVFEPNEEYGNPWSWGTVLYPAGFKKLKFDINKVKRGDILISNGHHTELANSASTTVGAHDNFDGVRGDWGTGNEIGIAPIYPGYWDYMLRLDTTEEKKKEEPKKEEKSMFKDVPTTDKYYPYIAKLAKLGIMKANKKGNFRPDAQVTRKELAVILCRLIKVIVKTLKK